MDNGRLDANAVEEEKRLTDDERSKCGTLEVAVGPQELVVGHAPSDMQDALDARGLAPGTP
jgi:hypothetical protein